MLKAILFDVDGVLIDSFGSNYRYFKEVFAESRYRPLTKDEFKKAFHLTLDDLIDKYMSKGDRSEFRRIYKIAYRLYAVPEAPKAMAGSLAALKEFSKEFQLGIVTGRLKQGVEEYLRNFAVSQLFATVVHSGHYKNPKPHPEPILQALKRLKVKPAEAVYVGDALTDIQAARAAKVRSILFAEKKFGEPDYHVRTFKELGRLIGVLAKEK